MGDWADDGPCTELGSGGGGGGVRREQEEMQMGGVGAGEVLSSFLGVLDLRFL